jgi:hypothetical protein
MGAQAIPVRTELVEVQNLGSGTRMSSIPGQTELAEVPKPVLVDLRFDRLSANGAGRSRRFDRLSANGILGRERWVGTAANGLNFNPVRTELVEGLEPVVVHWRFDRLSANGALKVSLAGRKAMG